MKNENQKLITQKEKSPLLNTEDTKIRVSTDI